MEKIFRVEGMTCHHCVQTVKRALGNIEGIRDIEVELSTGKVKITADREISCEEIKRVIEEWDYKVADC